ncbi:hypothetical protein TCAL_09158 [Tigriopus californicus]|uniref:Uncharacterized protein n=1 Tax=Tigriopus californicus TaxID=6832 RepID=A0A553N946_TIGCA|nr:hypothetical protein TCAL_09158 [Tigriopus californicus]
MSSYVSVVGTPTAETCCIFGLTPQEMRYLQSKFPEHMKKGREEGWNPKHGIRIECTCIVILNALGYIGFKVVSTAGDRYEFMWTLERNLDMDTQYQAIERSYNQ